MAEPRISHARLGKRTIDAEPTPGEGESRIWDTELKGFCLRLYPKSRKSPEGRRVYSVKFRIGRTQRWFTIGEHGSPWTPETARKKAEAIFRDVSDGIDPQAEKLERRADLTVSEWIDLYVEEGPKAKPSKRASSWAQDKSSLTRHVKPLIGRKVARDLRPSDVSKMIAEIVAGATARNEKTDKKHGRAIVRGGPAIAKRTASTLSAMFSWAIQHGGLKVAANPARGASVNAPKRAAKERFLSNEEAIALFDIIDTMETDKRLNAGHADAFRLLMLTGARRTEIAGLRWSEVDLVRRRLVLPRERTKAGEKSGERRIALNSAAVAILKKRPGSNKVYVFPAYRGEGPIIGLQKSWAAVRVAAGLPGLRIHDLRHSFASFAIADGASLFMVGKALGHSDTRVTERYAHLQGDALDDLAERAGRRMGRAEKANDE